LVDSGIQNVVVMSDNDKDQIVGRGVIIASDAPSARRSSAAAESIRIGGFARLERGANQ